MIDVLLKSKPTIDRYLAVYPPTVSVCHFSSLLMWAEHFNFVVQEIDSCLCITAQQPQAAFLYWPPIGHVSTAVIDNVMAQLRAVNPRTARIENISQQECALYQQQGLRCVEKYAEYIYVKEDIIQYQGNKFKSQRHDVNVLLKNHRVEVLQIKTVPIASCMEVFDGWAAHKKQAPGLDEIALDMLSTNRRAHELALNYQADLGLFGIAVAVDGKISAYSLGYPLNLSTFVVLLEVCDHAIHGLSAFIFNQMCKQDEFKAMTYVNAMDDFNLPGVALAKKLYHPCQLNPIFNAC